MLGRLLEEVGRLLEHVLVVVRGGLRLGDGLEAPRWRVLAERLGLRRRRLDGLGSGGGA